MKLSSLLDSEARLVGDGDTVVGGIACDSRKVSPGDMFAALSGSTVDGHLFIPEALSRGAIAILGGPSIQRYASAAALLIDNNPRLRLAKIAAQLNPGQPSFLAAVTGTNGKTSVAGFTRQLWTLAGRRAASLGTLGVEGEGRWPSTQLTTPDPVLLHRLCSQLAIHGVTHLALEASSHGLDQHRLDALRIDAAAFTNLSRDHFDYHGSVEAYFAAKSRLIKDLTRAGGTVVLNADIPEYARLRQMADGRELQVIDYGRAAKRFRILDIKAHSISQTLMLELDGRRHDIEVALVGEFQAANILAAVGLAVAGGLELAEAMQHIGDLRGVPGRMQLVARQANGAPAFVDYAHTPDALEKALAALRPHTTGRLHVVFGCGGDRDVGKREVMGRIACRLAEKVYVTDDNPRSEEPGQIRRQILVGCDAGKTVEVGDREAAIHGALEQLRKGDSLVVAGKGHESGQTIGDRTIPFDDAQVIRRALAEREGAA